MKVDLLTSTHALLNLQPEWNRLFARSPNATPFQSAAWLLSWWSVSVTHEPRVATLRDHGRLVGLLPLYILNEPSARKLLPIGAGITDYQDALLDRDLPLDAVSLLLDAALGAGYEDNITECALLDLPPGSALRTAPLPSGWREQGISSVPCPVLSLPTSPDCLREAIPAGSLRDLRQSLHRAERLSGWVTEIADGETLDDLLSALIRLHETRWHTGGERGLFCDPQVVAFHRRTAPELVKAGLLRLQVLRFAGTIVAGYYSLLTAEHILFYLSGFDPAFAHASPGTILLGHMIKQAVREGRRELHFLRGREAYKYAWGGADRMNIDRHRCRHD